MEVPLWKKIWDCIKKRGKRTQDDYSECQPYMFLGCVPTGRFTILFRVLNFLFALLMLCDIITDGLTANIYKTECKDMKVDCRFWQLALLFMFLPWISCVLFGILLQLGTYCYRWSPCLQDNGRRTPQTQPSEEDMWMWNMAGLFYTVYSPVAATLYTFKAVYYENMSPYTTMEEEEEKEKTSALKLPEVLFESRPQVKPNCIYSLKKKHKFS